MSEILSASFDYSSLPHEKAAAVRYGAERVRELHRSSVKAIIEIGKELVRIKAILPHGQFGPWLAAEFSMTERTAQRYMKAADVFGSNSDTMSEMRARTLYDLASESTPAPIREAVVHDLEDGKRVTDADVRARIKASKPAPAAIPSRLTEISKVELEPASPPREMFAIAEMAGGGQASSPAANRVERAAELIVELHRTIAGMTRADEIQTIENAAAALRKIGVLSSVDISHAFPSVKSTAGLAITIHFNKGKPI